MTIQPEIVVKVVDTWSPWFIDASDSFLFVTTHTNFKAIVKYDFDLNHIMNKTCTQITGVENYIFVDLAFDSVR